ncbi:MAG: KamA family radical SAM protein [Desulfobacterales bacterium]
MSNWPYKKLYNIEVFRNDAETLLKGIDRCRNLEEVRQILLQRVTRLFRYPLNGEDLPAHKLIRIRDCSLMLMSVFSERSDFKTGFSITKAIWDISRGRQRPDLKPGFYAELIHWIRGLEGKADFQFLCKPSENNKPSGREKAIARSGELDRIWEVVHERIGTYADGLSIESQLKRDKRRKEILFKLGGQENDWDNWKWHVQHLITSPDILGKLTQIEKSQYTDIKKALKGRLPFGITPYYVSLMDDEPSENDRAIRAQVIPPKSYVENMLLNRKAGEHSFDFMLESDTSPIDIITRRYPGVIIMKPVMTCPQICVYCQRNWEIEQVMAPHSFASESQINSAVKWINEHPAVHEVLVTGGDPFIMADHQLDSLLNRLAKIRHIDLIRIGTRIPVTLPMRITKRLAGLLGKYREVGKRDMAVMTHIEHPYEITPATAEAIDRLRCQGISVYNQQVFTFYVSRRFESTLLRILLRRIGVDPYYTFMPKGKEETSDYRVPIARILQEQEEEARLVPGLRRTDEAVFNIPGLGKNYLRAVQHRDLLTVLPDGRRVYEFHPWEMNITSSKTHIHKDMPILDYLLRLSKLGEDPEEYGTIWFYM